MSIVDSKPDSTSLSEAKRKILQRLQSGELPPHRSGPALSRRDRINAAPLSLMQEQLWLLENDTPSIPPLYNESVTLRFKQAVDVAILERSMAEVIRRHEIWRTSYDTVAGQPVQVVHPASDRFYLPLTDLRGVSEPEREAHALRLSLAQTARPFDLRDGPLLRAAVVAMTDSENWLLMTGHQSIIDGVSVYQVFPAELFAIYQAFSAGRSSPLPNLPLQFSDFACWQREWLSPGESAKQIAYWRKKLTGGIPVLRWPVEKSRPALQSFRGHIRGFTLRRNVAAAAHTLSRRQGTTLFGILLATFYSLLYFYTGQTDLIVGTLSPAGRKRSEVQSLLGYFLNPVALRVDLNDDPSFAELLHRVQITVSEAISNDDVPFEHVVKALNPPPDLSRNPYFTVGISLQPPMPESGGAWNVTSMDAESGGAKLDLYVAFIDRSEGLHARVQYNPDIFEFDEMRRMVEDFQSLLEGAAALPQRRLSDLRPT